ncbi:hypothetical protein DSO57_1001434 [Entomophthora muscae]|uniref:Uncharacterized protein n=1 Tax=Entomophthora muscae TaxID=34485 RepID=A0ACC2TK37_9FUNG|nr:hypothetical protein DSO57_1001434 [Entomophthora muscae]
MICVNVLLVLASISSQVIQNKAYSIDLSGVRSNNYRRFKSGEKVVDGRKLKYNGEYDYYQLYNVAESRASGPAVDVSECINCPVEGEVCPVYQKVRPRIYANRDSVVRIPEKLMQTLSQEDVIYTAITPSLKTHYNILPGFSAMLTFTPRMSNFTAGLKKCKPAGQNHGFWSKEEFRCKPFRIHQLVPITSTKGNAVGEFGYRKCDHTDFTP